MFKQERLRAKDRIAWLDIAKGISIFLVVFGHTLRGGMAQRIVYAFHVPAFFLLAGTMCKTDMVKSRICHDFIRIMVPYYCFGILSILVFSLLGQFVATQFEMSTDTSFMSNLWDLIRACPKGNRMKFNMPLWFLPCLFVTKLLYYVLSKLCKEKQGCILLGSIALAAIGFVYTRLGGPSLPFNFSVALKMLLFFSLGRSFYLILPAMEERFLVGSRAAILSVITIPVASLIAWFVPRVNYSGDTFPNITAFMAAAVFGSLGICFLSMWIGNCKSLEYIGRNTLAILVMHKFPVLLFQTVGPLKALLANYDSIAGVMAAALVSVLSIILCLTVECIIRRFAPFLLGEFG